LTKEETLKGDIKFHYGHLYLRSLTSAEDLELPKSIGRNLYLSNLNPAEREKIRKKYPNLRIFPEP